VGASGRTIHHNLFGLKITKMGHYRNSVTLFRGTNSVGAPMFGALGSIGAGDAFRYGLSLGAYHQDAAPFKKRQLTSFYPIAPIAGIDLGYFQKINKTYALGITSLSSPFLMTLGLSLEIKF